MTLTIGSLFSGYEGIGMAVERLFNAVTVWVSDIDKGACKILAHRAPNAVNIGDITKVDWSMVFPVDIITGGSPCQDISTAGKQVGMTEGTRSNLWVEMREAIAVLKPSYVIWENVNAAKSTKAHSDMEPCSGCVGEDSPGSRTLRALGRVLGDLASLGYDAEWRSLRASDVGACHRRERVFVLAYAQGVRHERPGTARVGRSGPPNGSSPARLTLLPTPMVTDTQITCPADAKRKSPQLRAVASLLPTPRATRGGSATETMRLLPTPSVADATGGHERRGGKRSNEPLLKGLAKSPEWGKYKDAIERAEDALGRPAPSPVEDSPKGGTRLSPAFVEWMMGLPEGWVTDVPGITRTESLKALGNGVVPAQAYAALADMLTCIPVANELEMAA